MHGFSMSMVDNTYEVDLAFMLTVGYRGQAFHKLLNKGDICSMVPIPRDMSKEERLSLAMPRKATHQAWCGPLYGSELLDVETVETLDMTHPTVAFTMIGGFAYFDKDGKCIT